MVFIDQKAGIELRFDIIEDDDSEYDYNYEECFNNIESDSANVNIDYSNNLINFKDIKGK